MESMAQFRNGLGVAVAQEDVLSLLFPSVMYFEHQAWPWLQPVRPKNAEVKYERGNPRGSVDKYFPTLKLAVDFVRDAPHKAEDHARIRFEQEKEQQRKAALLNIRGIALVSIYPGETATRETMLAKIEAARSTANPHGSIEPETRRNPGGVDVIDLTRDRIGLP